MARKAGQDFRVLRCVLLTHSAATSQRRAPAAPRECCIFLSKQTATAATGNQRMSIQRAGTGGGGREKRRAEVHILPPPFSARLCATASRRFPPPHNTTPPLGDSGKALGRPAAPRWFLSASVLPNCLYFTRSPWGPGPRARTMLVRRLPLCATNERDACYYEWLNLVGNQLHMLIRSPVQPNACEGE